MRILHDGPYLRLTLDRPARRNALDVESAVAMTNAIAEAREDRAVRVLILAAEGRVWCAGADLASMASHPGGHAAAMHAFADAMADLAESPVPVIAAVDGAVLGGGVGLLCAADIAVASPNATVRLPEAGVGVWPMMVGALLPRVTTPRVAMDLAVTGRTVEAAEAHRFGLFSSLAVDSAAMNAAVETAARQVAANSPNAIREGRAAWRAQGDTTLRARLHALADGLQTMARHPDAAEGIAAFFEKRPPRWTA